SSSPSSRVRRRKRHNRRHKRLLMSQRLHRVDPRRTARGPVARRKRGASKQNRHGGEGRRVGRAYLEQELGKNARRGKRPGGAQCQSRDRKRERAPENRAAHV